MRQHRHRKPAANPPINCAAAGSGLRRNIYCVFKFFFYILFVNFYRKICFINHSQIVCAAIGLRQVIILFCISCDPSKTTKTTWCRLRLPFGDGDALQFNRILRSAHACGIRKPAFQIAQPAALCNHIPCCARPGGNNAPLIAEQLVQQGALSRIWRADYGNL